MAAAFAAAGIAVAGGDGSYGSSGRSGVDSVVAGAALPFGAISTAAAFTAAGLAAAGQGSADEVISAIFAADGDAAKAVDAAGYPAATAVAVRWRCAGAARGRVVDLMTLISSLVATAS